MAVAVLFTTAAGCTSASQTELENTETAAQTDTADGGEPSEDTIKEVTLCYSWGFEEGFRTAITPETATNYGIVYLASNFYETLVNFESGEITPGLAESWDLSEDGTTYTFYLKEGVKFSDGEDFNAEVVKLNIKNIPGLLGMYNGSYGRATALIDEMTVIDDYTIEMTLSAPYSGFLQDLTMYDPMTMLSPNAYNEDGSYSDAIITHTMGTGPYMYSSNEDNVIYTFVKNPYYYGEEPEIDQFHVKVIPDNDAKALALRSGEIDLIVGKDNVDFEVYNDFDQDPAYSATSTNLIGQSRYISFNRSAEHLDLAVRQAINYVIDRETICQSLFYGIEEPQYAILSDKLPYCDVGIEAIPYDIEKAKQVLDAAGWVDSDGDGIREKDGISLDLSLKYMSSGTAKSDDMLLTIASAAKEAGINITLSPLDMMTYMTELTALNYDMVCSTTYGVPYDPYTTIINIMTSAQDGALSGGLSHLEDGDEILAEMLTIVDTNELAEQYAFVLNALYDNSSYAPISAMSELAVFNAEVIESYEFFGRPINIYVANITLK